MSVFEAKRRLNEFLEEHPELKPMQARIDALMKGAVTSNNRIILLKGIMMEKVKELRDSLEQLALMLNKFPKKED